MTDISDLKIWVANTFRSAGILGRGNVWRLKGRGVQWVVHLDKAPCTGRLGVDIGLDLQSETTPRLPTDCPILTHLENMPFAGGFETTSAFDLRSPLSPDRRRAEVEGVVGELARYVLNRATLNDVRAAYFEGEFDSAFVLKEARELLEEKR